MKSVEVAKTVLEVADVAWTAVEHTHHYRHRCSHPVAPAAADVCPSDQDLESLRSENRRLRNLLDLNLNLLQNLSKSPCLDNCPPDVFSFKAIFISCIKLIHRVIKAFCHIYVQRVCNTQ